MEWLEVQTLAQTSALQINKNKKKPIINVSENIP
jgi:hypothetical protein